MKYVSRLIPAFPARFVLYELPMGQGWAYYAGRLDSDPMMQFTGAEMKDGYIAQEVASLMKQLEGDNVR